MPAGPADLIVHLYSAEPAFSVKTRLMLGLEDAEWFAVNHPTILPYPASFGNSFSRAMSVNRTLFALIPSRNTSSPPARIIHSRRWSR